MKLINEFKAQLATLGDIKRVWLTSFTINIGFIETYLLPAVLGIDEPPKNRREFERLQFELIRQGIDFRVYCDQRLITQEQHKRTSINILPVSVRQIAPHLDAKNSLFHPKVIYLEDVNGNMILGAGSANLTLSGWGRNQEAMNFRYVSNNKQYQQVKSFFTAVDPLTEPDFRVRPKFSHADPYWNFIHSFSKKTLLKALAEGESIKTLSVWSPYLAADLAGFIDTVSHALGNPALKITLVPDLAQGYFLRTSDSEGVETLRESGRLCFCHNPIERDDRSELTHAKVWLATGETSARLAIGSWNFTYPGCGSVKVDSKEETHWNIEAGIVHRVPVRTKIAGKAFEDVDYAFASAELLEEEGLQLPAQLPFDLQVRFYWRSSQYEVRGAWFDGKPTEEYQLRLPGISQPILLRWRGGSLVGLRALAAEQPDDLLTQHFYTVSTQGEADWQGIIHEEQQEFRRVNGFDSLHDLLNSYIDDVDPQENDSVQLRELFRDGNSAEDELPTNHSFAHANATSYFRLFYALDKRRQHFLTLQNDDQLHYWLFTCPGCLLELVEKVRETLTQQPGMIFGWFLAQEVQNLCQLAKKRYRKKSLATSLWPKLSIDIPAIPAEEESRKKYLTVIKKRCKYEA
ncbi:hypothetical protein AB6D37_11350 [Pectobacterium brasiliense]|uniref:hypothetical protein n=1 Tax=Pectobacterium brasiliense TaxID=180957 RepID=UPI0039865D9B